MQNIKRTFAHPLARPRRNRAFTLVEVMVALAIVAIALPALMNQLITSLDSSGYVRDKTYAYWVAQNQLEMLHIEYALNKTFLKGEATGEVQMMDRTWHWQIVSELQSQDVIPGLYRQTVSVGASPDNMMASVVGYIRDETAELPTTPGLPATPGAPSSP